MSQKEQTQDRVIIFDTTMRDGEQSPGASMTLDEKLEIAQVLEEMGVDVIEAGFAIASNGDFEAVAKACFPAPRACGALTPGCLTVAFDLVALERGQRTSFRGFYDVGVNHHRWKRAVS